MRRGAQWVAFEGGNTDDLQKRTFLQRWRDPVSPKAWRLQKGIA
jgi:hypothetical protein